MSVLNQFGHNYLVNVTENGKCSVFIDGYVGVDNIPLFTRVINITLFLLYVIYVAVTLFWMWIQRHAPLLRKRGDFGLILLSALGGLLLFFHLIRDFFGRENIPCAIFLWFTVLTPPLVIGPVFVRLVLFRNRAIFYEEIKSIGIDVYMNTKHGRNLRNLRIALLKPRSIVVALKALQLDSYVSFRTPKLSSQGMITRPSSLRLTNSQKKQQILERQSLAALSVESINTGFNTSCAFTALLMTLIMFPFVVYGTVKLVTVPIFQTFDCYGCELTFDDMILPVVSSLVATIVVLSIAYRIHGAPDPFGILKEIVFVLLVGLVLGMLSTALLIIDPGHVGKSGLFTWHYFTCTMVFAVHTIQCCIPTLRTYRSVPSGSRPGSAEMDLKALLTSSTGVVLFQEHMANEFNVESLKFYVEAKKWIDGYDTRDSDSNTTLFYEIYHMFIERGSFMECNISDEARRKLDAFAMKICKGECRDVPKEIFNESLGEVWSLMSHDSFPRFLKSKIYKEWIESSTITGTITTLKRESKIQDLLPIDKFPSTNYLKHSSKLSITTESSA